jgi:hypothetical protein
VRRLVAALALGTFLLALPSAPAATIRAFHVSDGSEDPAFVRLGARTRIDLSVPDGARGVYLIGRIVVNGGARQIVHVRASGGIDRRFRPAIRGGFVQGAALQRGKLALIGTFRSIDGRARARIAVVDASTGRPLRWKPQLPISASLYSVGQVVFAGRTLVVSTAGGLFAWRPGARRKAWARDFQYALIAPWHGALWAVVSTSRQGTRLASIDPATGRARITGGRLARAPELHVVGGRLLALSQGRYWRVDHPNDVRLIACGQARGATNAGLLAVALAGDASTLYVADAPVSTDAPGSIPGVAACPWSGGATRFRSPLVAYAAHGPTLTGLALIGTHVLAFTRGA